MDKIFIENQARDKAYDEMCSTCERASYCHNWCETCDEYEDRADEIYENLLKSQEGK